MESSFCDFDPGTSSKNNDEQKNFSTKVELDKLKQQLDEEDRSETDALLAEFLIDTTPSNEIGFVSQADAMDLPTSKELQSTNDTNVNIADKSVSEALNSMITSVSTISDNDSTTKEFTKQSSKQNSDGATTNEYRCPNEAWSEDEDASTSDSSSDSDSFFQTMRDGPEPKKVMPVKTKGELEIEDLPPIEDLLITVTEQEMELIGKIYAIVEKLVVIRAVKDTKPLDLDSVLFLSHEKPLGRIFDVFGQVEQPFYSIRFNSVEHIKEKGVTVDADVFFAPKKEEITSYVFVDDLQKQKGSDASWKHNNEPPDEFLDYSDDEQERAARKQRVSKSRNQSFSNSMAKNDSASKKPLLAGDSPDTPIYIPPPRPPPPRRNVSLSSFTNPFSTPRPLISPSTTLHVLSPAPPAYMMSRPNLQPQPMIIQRGSVRPRPMSPVVFTNYQPPMFGQMTMVSPISPAVHTQPPPPVFYSPVPQQNYFAQRFPRTPSPAPMTPDPWLPNRAPYLQSNLPPNAPLTVQIPPNISSPSPPIHPYQQVNGSVQQFVGASLHPPFFNPVQLQQQHQLAAQQQHQARFSNPTLQRFY